MWKEYLRDVLRGVVDQSFLIVGWTAVPGGGGGGVRDARFLANFSAFNIMPVGVAWKESTSNGPRPPNRRAVALHLYRWLFE